MTDVYDFAVVGLGAIGSAAAAELARRGHSVLGLDQYHPPHTMGSSHSDTRMIREAYYQGSPYMPMVRAAYESWARLEAESGRELLRPTGGLMIGPRDGRVFAGTLEIALTYGLDYEALSAEDMADRFPAFHLEPDTLAIFEPRAGVLALEDCLDATLESATRAGADLRFDEAVTGWTGSGDGLSIQTRSAEYRARRLAVIVGAWTGGLVPDLRLPLEVERTVQYWFEPATEDAGPRFEPAQCPPWVWEYGDQTAWYGFPRTSHGVKVGMHVQPGRQTAVEHIDRATHASDETAIRSVLHRFMPDASGSVVQASVCMYTNTPDEHFILDRHPDHPEVVIFSGGSGHAFKFALVLGEILSDLLIDDRPEYDLSPFSIGRF